MALQFETGTFSSTNDLIRTKLRTFLEANGWTTDDNTADGKYAAHVDTLYMSFRWDTAISSGTHYIGVYQALGFISTATNPGNHTNDSGQGVISGTNATIATGRCADIDNGSHTYWFFLSDAAPKYCHVIVEAAASLQYRHFGFGHLDKFGSWTGGEYAYADRNSNDAGTSDRAIQGDSTVLLDGLAGSDSTAEIQPYVASLHMESMPGQVASGKWALVWDGGTPTNNDRGGTGREWAPGGFRGGLVANPFGRFFATPVQGLIPLYPINILLKERSATQVYPIGQMSGVRGINIRHFVGGQEITVGGETWVVFPARRKDNTGTGGSQEHGTVNQGIAYRKS